MTVGSLSPVRALSICDRASFRPGRAGMRAKSGGWGMGGPAFCPQRLRPGRGRARRALPEMPGPAGPAGNARRGV